MSRQMAFQINEYEYRQILGRLVAMYDEKDAKSTMGEWIECFEPDKKKQDRIKAVLVISTKCNKEGLDPLLVTKLVCWRDEKGEPGLIEATLNGGRPMAVRR